MEKKQKIYFISSFVVMLFLLSSIGTGAAGFTQSARQGSYTNPSTRTGVMVSCVADGIPIKKQISVESCQSMQQVFSAVVEANAVDPCGEKTRILKVQFIEMLSDLGLLSNKITTEEICSLIEPPWSRTSISHRRSHLMPPRSLDEDNATLFFCSMAGAGWGFVIPPVLLPRPRLFMQWRGFYPDSSAVSVAEMATGRGVIARGTQVGNAFGFIGVGFAFAFPGAPAQFGFLGYSLMTILQGADMTWYYANFPPLVMGASPEDGAFDVPVSLSELRFTLKDYDWDKMTYSVVTSPDIGSGSDGNVGNGEYSIPVSGLDGGTTYTWTVSVSDGTDTVENTFTFTTEAVAPVISNPIPDNGEKDVPMDITQLQFTLKDPQGDAMEYTVETSPDIGSEHEIGVHDGTFTVPVSGLTYGATYRWFVNVTDGIHWTRKVFSFETGYPVQFDPFDYGWQYRKPIAINHELVTDDLEDFPVFLSITDSDLIKAQGDGDDLLFMNDVGAAIKLRHELEEFNPGTGALIAWVKIPALSAEENTVFYLYYGNPSCINQEYPEKTWDSNYVAVWHMNDATLTTISDSTINSITGTKKAIHTPTEWSGKTGHGQLYNRSSTVWEYITMGDSDLLEFSGDFTVSAWVKPFTTENMRIAGKHQDISGNYKGYALNWNLQGPGTKMSLRVDGGGFNYQYIFANADEPPNNWYFMTGTKQSGINYLYINGTRQIQTGSQTLTNSEYPFCIGGWKTDDASANFHGIIDEVRVSKIGRSSSWIQTEYNNQNSPSTFLTFGPEETGP